MKLVFDGDSIPGSATPTSLDMEDDNMIDVKVLPSFVVNHMQLNMYAPTVQSLLYVVTSCMYVWYGMVVICMRRSTRLCTRLLSKSRIAAVSDEPQ